MSFCSLQKFLQLAKVLCYYRSHNLVLETYFCFRIIFGITFAFSANSKIDFYKSVFKIHTKRILERWFMAIQILWGPHDGKCSQCGLSCPNVRMFMSEHSVTDLCKECWFLFVLECDIPPGSWENQVSDDWDVDTDMILSCDETQQIISTDMVMQEDQILLQS